MHRLIFSILLVLLAGCGPVSRQTVTHLDVALLEDRYAPNQWRVPGGQEISLTLSNPTHETREWAVYSAPPGEPNSPTGNIDILARFVVEAGQTRTVTFTTPSAPGQYTITSSLPGQSEAGLKGKLLIVQPGY